MSNQVHKVAASGFGTGTNDLYDRARPSYQSVALSHIHSSLKGSGPFNIAEIGAGTGIFTRALLSHPSWSSSIASLKAIEPSPGMRDVFARNVQDSRVAIQEGTFDSTGLEDGWADLIVIAQAFHWCPDYNAACAEFGRILKPNGALAFIWNLENRHQAQWVAQLRERIESHEEGTPQFRLMLWRAAFDTPSYQKFFETHEETVFDYVLEGTLPLAVDRACSKSYIAILPDDEKEKVVNDVTDIVRKGEGKVWIDEEKGVFEYPYQTFVVVSQKK